MDRPVSESRFLTAAQVAELLRLNHQVVLRKLQSGEIPGYKIGKDWRVEEMELQAWLDSVRNRADEARDEGADAQEEAIRNHFFVDGKLKQIPARRSKRAVVLRILARRFEKGRAYRESEVNALIKSAHPDFCTLRRELVMARLLEREKGTYRRTEGASMEEGERAGEPQSSA